MIRLFLSAIAAAAFLTGCGNNSSSSAPSTNSAPANTAAGGSAPGVLGQAQQYSIQKADIASLTQAIQQFNAGEGRYPKDLQELVPTYLAKIPEAPTGYKLNYDPATGTVTVVKQ